MLLYLLQCPIENKKNLYVSPRRQNELMERLLFFVSSLQLIFLLYFTVKYQNVPKTMYA